MDGGGKKRDRDASLVSGATADVKSEKENCGPLECGFEPHETDYLWTSLNDRARSLQNRYGH